MTIAHSRVVKAWVRMISDGSRMPRSYRMTGKNMRFENDRVYSYDTIIAARHCHKVALLNPSPISMSTSRHQNIIRRELSRGGIEYYEVPNVVPNTDDEHRLNAAFMRHLSASWKYRADKARTPETRAAYMAKQYLIEANRSNYMKLFLPQEEKE